MKVMIEDNCNDSEFAYTIFAAHLACNKPIGGTIRFPKETVARPRDEIIELECLAMLQRHHECPAAKSSVLYKAGVLH